MKIIRIRKRKGRNLRPTNGMDSIDRELVRLLQEDGKRSHAELSEAVGLAVSTVNERLKKLHAQGVVRRYVALIDPKAFDLDICAFVQVLITGPQLEQPFEERMERIPEVLECHSIAGEFSYLLKVRVRSTAHLEQFLREHIKSVPGVVRTHSMIVLTTPKETTAIPVPG